MSQLHPHPEPTTEQLLATLGLEKVSMPWSEEAEKGLLSCLLQDPDNRLPEVKSLVPESYFYHQAHRAVYGLILEMWDKAIPFDIALLTHWLRERQLLDRVGGASFISEIYTFIPIPEHYPFFLKALTDKAHLRRMIRADTQNILSALHHGRERVAEDVSALLDEAESRIRSVRDGTHAGEFKSMAENMDELADELEEQIRKHQDLSLTGETALPGTSTGLPAVDERTGGYRKGHVWLVQASSGDGKTSWAIQQSLEQSLGASSTPVAYYLTEGSKNDFLKKIIAHRTRIHLGRLMSGDLSEPERSRIADAMREIGQSKMVLRHKPGMTKREILADMRFLHAKYGRPNGNSPSIVFVIDYLQRIRGCEKGQAKHEHIADTSTLITDMNGSLGACTILLSQIAAGDGKTAGSKDVICDADVEMTISCPPKNDPVTGKPMVKENRHGEVKFTKDEERRVITFGKGRVVKRGGAPVALNFLGDFQLFQ